MNKKELIEGKYNHFYAQYNSNDVTAFCVVPFSHFMTIYGHVYITSANGVKHTENKTKWVFPTCSYSYTLDHCLAAPHIFLAVLTV